MLCVVINFCLSCVVVVPVDASDVVVLVVPCLLQCYSAFWEVPLGSLSKCRSGIPNGLSDRIEETPLPGRPLRLGELDQAGRIVFRV